MEAALDALGLSADGIDLGGIDAKVDLAVAVEESASGVRGVLVCNGVVRLWHG